MSNNPFDPNYKSQIDWTPLRRSAEGSKHSSRAINEKRLQGIEPSIPNNFSEKPKHMEQNPKKFAVKGAKK